MSRAADDTPAVCPRCQSRTTEVRSTSPVAGVWTVFGCTTCFYAWRSTEPEENSSPDKYPAVFRLRPEQLPNLPISPSIPPIRRAADGQR
jgi:vanillate/4-hydroxybenzoate decarboxylase subunit D